MHYKFLGRLVRVILLGVIADHPAMVKVCGFPDHSHRTFPCTKCTVNRDEMFSSESLKNGTLNISLSCTINDAYIQNVSCAMVRNIAVSALNGRRHSLQTERRYSRPTGPVGQN